VYAAPPRKAGRKLPRGALRGEAADPMVSDMKRILVVDDDAASCAAATAILQELGCAVETMADGDTALERLQQVVPDALLVGSAPP
jgi:PleD family two-component response regulator